jgi:hypothetical protein
VPRSCLRCEPAGWNGMRRRHGDRRRRAPAPGVERRYGPEKEPSGSRRAARPQVRVFGKIQCVWRLLTAGGGVVQASPFSERSASGRARGGRGTPMPRNGPARPGRRWNGMAIDLAAGSAATAHAIGTAWRLSRPSARRRGATAPGGGMHLAMPFPRPQALAPARSDAIRAPFAHCPCSAATPHTGPGVERFNAPSPPQRPSAPAGWRAGGLAGWRAGGVEHAWRALAVPKSRARAAVRSLAAAPRLPGPLRMPAVAAPDCP